MDNLIGKKLDGLYEVRELTRLQQKTEKTN